MKKKGIARKNNWKHNVLIPIYRTIHSKTDCEMLQKDLDIMPVANHCNQWDKSWQM